MKTPLEKLMEQVEWTPIAPLEDLKKATEEDGVSGLPYCTHKGILKIGNSTIKCFRLNTGIEVMNSADFEMTFGFTGSQERKQ